MAKLKRPNPQVLRIFLETVGWMLLVAIIPSTIYAFKYSAVVGLRAFLIFFVVIVGSLVYAFWAALFPKNSQND